MDRYTTKFTYSEFLTNEHTAFSDDTKTCMKKANILLDSIMFNMKPQIDAALISIISKQNLYKMMYNLVTWRENQFMKMLHRISTMLVHQERYNLKLKEKIHCIETELAQRNQKDREIIWKKREKKRMKIFRKKIAGKKVYSCKSSSRIPIYPSNLRNQMSC